MIVSIAQYNEGEYELSVGIEHDQHVHLSGATNEVTLDVKLKEGGRDIFQGSLEELRDLMQWR